MQCQIANPTNLEMERLLTVTVHLGNQVEEIGTIHFREPPNLLVILIPAFSGVIILIVAVFIVMLVLMQRCQKRQHLFFCSAAFEPEVGEPHVYCVRSTTFCSLMPSPHAPPG